MRDRSALRQKKYFLAPVDREAEFVHETMSRIDLIINIVGAIVGIGLLIYAFAQSTDWPRLALKLFVTALVGWFIYKEVVPGFAKGGGDAINALIFMLAAGLVLAVIWRHTLIEFISNPIHLAVRCLEVASEKFQALRLQVSLRRALAEFPAPQMLRR